VRSVMDWSTAFAMSTSNYPAPLPFGVAEDGPDDLDTIYRKHRVWLIARGSD
jgi:hypothetical protein